MVNMNHLVDNIVKTMKVTTIVEDNGCLVLIIRDLMNLTEEYHDSMRLNDRNSVDEIVSTAYSMIDKAPRTKIRVLALDGPVKDNVIIQPLLGMPPEDFYVGFSMSLSTADVRIRSVDDAIAIAWWERIGSNLKDNPPRQLSWSRSSRLLSVQSTYDHMGISLIDDGHLIAGLSKPYDDYDAKWGSLENIIGSSDDPENLKYYKWSINQIMGRMKQNWSPDSMILTINGDSTLAPKQDAIGLFNHNHTDYHDSYNGRSIPSIVDSLHEQVTYDVITSDSSVSRSQLVSEGVTLIEQKDMFGWTPKFLKDAECRDDLDDQLLEYEFDMSTDSSEDNEDDHTQSASSSTPVIKEDIKPNNSNGLVRNKIYRPFI